MKKSLLVMAAALPLLLSGCVVSVGGDDDNNWHSDWHETARENRDKISNLETGMSLQNVKRKMGVAEYNELYQKDGAEYQVLFYRTRHVTSDGITTKDECTALVFKNGSLFGFGDKAYQEL